MQNSFLQPTRPPLVENSSDAPEPPKGLLPDNVHPPEVDQMQARCQFCLNNPHLVVVIHAIRIELIVSCLMSHIVHSASI